MMMQAMMATLHEQNNKADVDATNAVRDGADDGHHHDNRVDGTRKQAASKAGFATGILKK